MLLYSTQTSRAPPSTKPPCQIYPVYPALKQHESTVQRSNHRSRLRVLRTEKIANLRIYDFVTIRSRGGTAYSVLSVCVDCVHIRGISIPGDVQPNSGSNVIAAFSGESKTKIVGWLDPITHAPVVMNSRVITSYPIILVMLFPLLLISIFLSPKEYRDIAVYLVFALCIVLMLLPSMGNPGVKRHLLRAQAQSAQSLS